MALYLAGLRQAEICQYHQFQGNTNDCGPFSIAMAVSLFHGLPNYADGKAIARRMNRYPLLARVPGWATFPWGIAWFVRQHFGIHARFSVFTSESSLLENLERGHITIVAMGWRTRHWLLQGHFSLLYGYEPDSVLLLNPADIHCPSRVEREEFLQKWRFFGRITITVGEPDQA